MSSKIGQLHAASREFPSSFIDTKQGASYVEHSVITQRLMEVFGFFDMTNVELIRGHVPAWKDPDHEKYQPPLEDAVTGVLLTLRVHTDSGLRTITEIGEVEFPHNHTTDASRAKHATSDAIKRCAMRLGIGLHLWAQGHYYLARKMDQLMADMEEPDSDEVMDAPDPEVKPVDPDEPTPAEPTGDDETDEQQARMDVLTDLLKHFPDPFVATLDTDRMYAFADESDDNLKQAIDLIEQKHQTWEAEHDADEQLAVPAPGFYFAKGGGHYLLYDSDGVELDPVRGQDNVPAGYAELDQPIVQVEVVEEGNDQPAKAPGDGSKTFAEELASYPDPFIEFLKADGVNLEVMERHAGRSDELKVNALKIVSNRWREWKDSL